MLLLVTFILAPSSMEKTEGSFADVEEVGEIVNDWLHPITGNNNAKISAKKVRIIIKITQYFKLADLRKQFLDRFLMIDHQ